MLVRAVVVACAVVALLAACSSDDDPPPTNPLADTSTPVATGTADATQPPTVTPTPQDPEPTVPPEQALEVFTGNAIELMAEWLGVPATDLAVAEAEALVWPDGCLGVEDPGVSCIQVLTPGFRVVLSDAFDGLHRVHAGPAGELRWAGEAVATGEVSAVQGAAVTIDAGSGEVTAIASPGTRYSGVDGPTRLDELEALAGELEGLRLAIGLDPSPTGGAIPVLAWLTVIE
jgi:hypothetical protein